MKWLAVFCSLAVLLCSLMSIPVFLAGQGEVFRHVLEDDFFSSTSKWKPLSLWVIAIGYSAMSLAAAGATAISQLDHFHRRTKKCRPLEYSDLRSAVCVIESMMEREIARRERAEQQLAKSQEETK